MASIRKLICIFATLSVAFILLPATLAEAQVPPVTSVGNRVCTIIGTPSSETLNGTSGNDVLCGLGGNDTINGLGGNDIIDGGSGFDTLRGGEGDDLIIGANGADTMSGGNGTDTVTYADRNVAISASLDGIANDGAALEADSINSDVENLVGGSAGDVLTGNGARNSLAGGGGNDRLEGGTGNDYLLGGSGADVLNGGGDFDTVSYSDHSTSVNANLDGAANDGSTGEGDRVGNSVESLIGGSANDRLVGNDLNNVIYGGTGFDSISGGGGSDQLFGGDGNDSLSGGTGTDVVVGENGNDLLTGDQGIDILNGGSGTNTCDWDVGEATINSCRYDNDGPTIVSLTTSQATVGSGDAFSVDLRLRDAAGADLAGVTFSVGGLGNDFCGQFMTLVSGNGNDGVWRLSCTVPANVRGGTYTVTPYARDRLNNWTNTNGGRLDATRATFTVTGGSNDSRGPEIVSLTVSRTNLSPGDTFTVDARVTDSAGVSYAGVSFAVNSIQNDFCGQSMTQVSGSSTDGVWRLTCTVPQLVRNGNYEVTPYAQDQLNNFTNTNGGYLDSTRAAFTITGGSDDSTGPEIVSLTVSKASVIPGDTFTVDARVTDPSGVDYAGVMFSVGGLGNDFCGQFMTRVSGTATNGIWRLTCTVPLASKVGVYTVTPYAKDFLNNHTNTNGGNLDDTRATFTVR